MLFGYIFPNTQMRLFRQELISPGSWWLHGSSLSKEPIWISHATTPSLGGFWTGPKNQELGLVLITPLLCKDLPHGSFPKGRRSLPWCLNPSERRVAGKEDLPPTPTNLPPGEKCGVWPLWSWTVLSWGGGRVLRGHAACSGQSVSH